MSALTVNPTTKLPTAGTKLLVSRGGGASPRWRRDSQELFYQRAGGTVMAVDVSADKSAHRRSSFRRGALKPSGTRPWTASDFSWPSRRPGSRHSRSSSTGGRRFDRGWLGPGSGVLHHRDHFQCTGRAPPAASRTRNLGSQHSKWSLDGRRRMRHARCRHPFDARTRPEHRDAAVGEWIGTAALRHQQRCARITLQVPGMFGESTDDGENRVPVVKATVTNEP